MIGACDDDDDDGDDDDDDDGDDDSDDSDDGDDDDDDGSDDDDDDDDGDGDGDSDDDDSDDDDDDEVRGVMWDEWIPEVYFRPSFTVVFGAGACVAGSVQNSSKILPQAARTLVIPFMDSLLLLLLLLDWGWVRKCYYCYYFW